MKNRPFSVSKFYQNLSTNVTKTTHTMLHITIFFQYLEGFNFIKGKATVEFKDVHVNIPNQAPSITPYTKPDIRNGYIVPEESAVYHKSENYEFFRKQNWFGAVYPNVQTDAKLDYIISRVSLKMNHTSLSIYKKLCNLDCDLKQTAFFLLTQNFLF